MNLGILVAQHLSGKETQEAYLCIVQSAVNMDRRIGWKLQATIHEETRGGGTPGPLGQAIKT